MCFRPSLPSDDSLNVSPRPPTPMLVMGEAGVYSGDLRRDEEGSIKRSLECVGGGMEVNFFLLMELRLAWRPGQKEAAAGWWASIPLRCFLGDAPRRGSAFWRPGGRCDQS